ncbi:MAG: hypothetical protein PHV34_15145 [Verrucomicrobiae bacterium]|nr:hypothetical protein [Verrucomicrobiae bacterium]
MKIKNLSLRSLLTLTTVLWLFISTGLLWGQEKNSGPDVGALSTIADVIQWGAEGIIKTGGKIPAAPPALGPIGNIADVASVIIKTANAPDGQKAGTFIEEGLPTLTGNIAGAAAATAAAPFGPVASIAAGYGAKKGTELITTATIKGTEAILDIFANPSPEQHGTADISGLPASGEYGPGDPTKPLNFNPAAETAKTASQSAAQQAAQQGGRPPSGCGGPPIGGGGPPPGGCSGPCR